MFYRGDFSFFSIKRMGTFCKKVPLRIWLLAKFLTEHWLIANVPTPHMTPQKKKNDLGLPP